MLIARGALLERLNEARPGLSTKEVLEQSHCFVFSEGTLLTFNEDILVRTTSPVDFTAVVNAADLLGLLAKLPDDEVDIDLVEGEIRIKGMGSPNKEGGPSARKSSGRRAGIAAATDILLPLNTVPIPEKWSRLGEGALGGILQAAKCCGNDEAQYLATCVHVTPELAEGCDNLRMLRWTGPTGFPSDCLLPAGSVNALEGMEVKKLAVAEGWCHFRVSSGAEISLRISSEPYHSEIDQVLKMKKPEKLLLPANLKEIIKRTEFAFGADADPVVTVALSEDLLTIRCRKEGAWYKERRAVEYRGRRLEFDINPQFLLEILERTREVAVDESKIKIAYDNIEYVATLTAKENSDE